jgi:hypothetical protein
VYTCEYDQSTGAVLSPNLPALLAPGMPDIYPGNPNNTLNRDPCEWQSWFLNVQVGGQIHDLRVQHCFISVGPANVLAASAQCASAVQPAPEGFEFSTGSLDKVTAVTCCTVDPQ